MRKMMETNGATSNLRQVLDHLRAALPLHGDARQRYLNELAVSDADLAGEVDRRLRRYRQHQQLARLGEYELFEVIGRGGVGVVYRARQIGSSRELAIKVLPGFGSSLSDHKRVLQAYESVSRLSHPSIVPVLSVTTGRDGQICS